MGKFYGIIGFVSTQEKEGSPGVFVETAEEREYYGDVIRIVRRWQGVQDRVNDDVNLDNQISILSDPYAFENMSHIRYVDWMGSLWKVTSVEVQYPRLLLSIGGIYNGIHREEEGTRSDSD